MKGDKKNSFRKNIEQQLVKSSIGNRRKNQSENIIGKT